MVRQVEERLLRVAVIGMPNAGKSTFINNLMDRKVCATSSKVRTTRKKSQAIFTEENTQIVFVDTPGVVNEKEMKRFNLEKNFTKDSKYTLRHADIVGVIHDVSNFHARERLDVKIINLLNDNSRKPSFLVLNKMEADKRTRRPAFDEIGNKFPAPQPHNVLKKPTLLSVPQRAVLKATDNSKKEYFKQAGIMCSKYSNS